MMLEGGHLPLTLNCESKIVHGGRKTRYTANQDKDERATNLIMRPPFPQKAMRAGRGNDLLLFIKIQRKPENAFLGHYI